MNDALTPAPPSKGPGSIFRLLRVKQWAKNLLVFAAPLFSGLSGHASFAVPAIGAFFAMSMASSATYIFNDLLDVERDRQHPTKRFRPLASGAVSKSLGTAIGFACLILGISIGAVISKGSCLLIITYLLLQILYNWKLKRMPIADVYTIAVGFILRAVLGAAAIGVSISGWLLFCTGALALMLGFAKRRNEFIVQGEDRTTSRESLAHYSKSALDALVCMFASGAAMCYAIYSLQSKTAHKFPGLIFTSVFVFYGIARYVLLVFAADEGGEPADVLFRDPHIIFSVVGFVIAAGLATYGIHVPLLEQ